MQLVVRRLLQGGAIVFLVASLSFVLIHAAPGDPWTALDNPSVTEEMRQRLRQQHGLDRPIAEQFAVYLKNVATGELGFSFSQHRNVGAVLADTLPNTLILMGTALVLSFTLGIVLGTLQAFRPGSRADQVVSAISTALAAMPPFWVAIVLLMCAASWFDSLPLAGMIDPLHAYMTPAQQVLDRLKHLALPAITLTLLNAPEVARYQRAALLEILPEDYLRTARAKGLSERRIMVRHALRNALLPTIAVFGLSFPTLVGGTVFVETAFSWQGMGMIAVDALRMRDYPLVLAVAIVASMVVVLGNLFADLLSAAANPRLRTT